MRGALLLSTLLILPPALAAQEDGRSLDRITPGTRVRLTGPAGAVTAGRFALVEDGRVVLSDLADCYGTACPDVASLELAILARGEYAAGNRALTGALVGGGVGLALGALLGALAVENSLEDPSLKLVAAVAYGGVGAGVGLLGGALVGLGHTRWRPILLPPRAGTGPAVALALPLGRLRSVPPA